MNRLAAVALLVASTSPVLAQPLTSALTPFAAPFAATDTSARALTPILSAMRDARVIGIGEPTHGTAEVFRFKHQLIRRLVESGGVRHLVLEASVGEGADFDDYVAGRRDDLAPLLANLPLWMFQTTEFADLLRWLRAYNATAARPVRVYGMEAQYADRSVRHAIAYLRAMDPSLAARFVLAFGAVRVASDTASAASFSHLYGALTDSTLTAWQTLFVGLRSTLDTRRDELVRVSSLRAFTEARRHVTAIGQFAALAVLEDSRARAQLRDYIMALNVSGVVQRADTGERVVVWAHNEHVGKREGNGGYDVLGRQLHRWFGDAYYAIGFDMGTGTFRAPAADGWVHDIGPLAPDSFTASLARAGAPDLFLDLREALRTPAGAEALRTPKTVRETAGGQLPMRNGVRVIDQSITLGDRFDGLVFLARSSPSTRFRR